jgi:hypothetical protein
MALSDGGKPMAIKQNDLNPPKILRAHRPKPTDAQSVPYADVQLPAQRVTETLSKRPSWIHLHLTQIGLTMLFLLGLWVGINLYVIPFVTDKIDHWNYGDARISQFDMNVGHNGTSHFVTQYWHNQVILIEMPENDPTHSKTYATQVLFVGRDTGQHSITLKTAYVGQHPIQGKPDIVATVSGFVLPVIFYNTGSGFTAETR